MSSFRSAAGLRPDKVRRFLSLSAVLLLASALATGCGGKSKPMTTASPANSADEAAPGGGEEAEGASADPCGGGEAKKKAAPDGADPCGGGE